MYTKTSAFQKVAGRHFVSMVIAAMICLTTGIPAWGKPTEAVQQQQQQQRLSLKLENKSIKESLAAIEKVSRYVFFYPADLASDKKLTTLDVKNETIENILDKILSSTKYIYRISDTQVFITERGSAQQQRRKVSGRVINEAGEPLARVTIAAKNTSTGTATDAAGMYSLDIPLNSKLRFSYVGYAPQEIDANRDVINVTMKEENAELEEIVVNGIFARKAESYAGAARTFTAKELATVGNQNVIQSLKSLDPTLFIMDNLTMGSDPNTLPEMQIRGTSSFPAGTETTNFKGNYGNKPNQPLIILDGFESTLEHLIDMDMNRIETVTLLKDAAAKAVYGSKAANGVIVVETKRLAGNEQRVYYNGSIDFTMPDLTSYDLTNSLEKLQVELMEGVYTTGDPASQQRLTEQYNTYRKLALEGLDTYWLAKPLQTGIGQKHNIGIEVGDSRNFRGNIDFTYNKITGVMKGSDRTNISGNVTLSYRLKDVTIRNIMGVISNKSENSPWGTFSDYSKMNPYWRAVDAETGKLLRWADKDNWIPNPMYDATIGTLYKETYQTFTNNFYVEWKALEGLTLRGRFGVDTKRSDGDEFLPVNHSKYSTSTYMDGANEDLKMRRGRFPEQYSGGYYLCAAICRGYQTGRHIFYSKDDEFSSGGRLQLR